MVEARQRKSNERALKPINNWQVAAEKVQRNAAMKALLFWQMQGGRKILHRSVLIST